MEQLREYCERMARAGVDKIVISKPIGKEEPYRRIVVERKKDGYVQISRYTERQAFHENLPQDRLGEACYALVHGHFLQVNGWGPDGEHILLLSKKGACTY